MKTPAYKITKKINSYKPLIFESVRLPQPKIPLKLIKEIHKPQLIEFQKITVAE